MVDGVCYDDDDGVGALLFIRYNQIIVVLYMYIHWYIDSRMIFSLTGNMILGLLIFA